MSTVISSMGNTLIERHTISHGGRNNGLWLLILWIRKLYSKEPLREVCHLFINNYFLDRRCIDLHTFKRLRPSVQHAYKTTAQITRLYCSPCLRQCLIASTPQLFPGEAQSRTLFEGEAQSHTLETTKGAWKVILVHLRSMGW